MWSHHRYEFDDAYISYRYAANLASGEGLVFNPGERVEGYSNFLWVLVLAAGDAVGLKPPHLGPLLGVIAYLSMIVLAWAAIWTPFFNLELTGLSRYVGTAMLAILITAHGLASTAGAGLETHFFALLVLSGALVLATANLQTVRSLTLIGIIPVLLFLTRPDGVVPGTAMLIVIVMRSAHERSSWSIGLLSGGIAAAPAITIGIAYGIFKLIYFGSILPNPYHAKGADALHLDAGLAYLRGFLQSYPFIVLGIGLVAAAVVMRPRNEAFQRVGLYTLVISFAYGAFVIKVGGDFMEYRLGLHILPTVVVATVFAAPTLTRRWWAGALFAVILIGLSIRSPVLEERHYMQSLEEMNSYAEAGRRVGKALAHLPPHTSIATTLIGTIGYESGLRIIDQWGLVDPEVRKRAPRPGFSRGHVRYAGRRECRLMGAHLYLEHPQFCGCTPDCIRNPHQLLIATDNGECVRAEVLVPDAELLATLCGDRIRYPVIGGRMCRQ